MNSVAGTFEASLRSLGTAVTLAAVGFYLHRRGFVEHQGKKTLAVLSQQVTFPLFLFTKINACKWATTGGSCPSVAETLYESWLLLIWPVYVVGMGLLTGMLVNRVVRTPPHQAKAVLAACAFANSTGLPITLLTVVHENFPDTSDLGRVDPTIFLSVYLLLYPVLQWGLGGWLLAEDDVPIKNSKSNGTLETVTVNTYDSLKVISPITTFRKNILNTPKSEQYFSHRKLASLDEGIYVSQLDLAEMGRTLTVQSNLLPTLPASPPSTFDEDDNDDATPRAYQSVPSATYIPSRPPHEMQSLLGNGGHEAKSRDGSCLTTFKKVLSRCFQPPVVGSLLGIFFAVTPLRGLLVDVNHTGHAAPLEWLFDGLAEVGKAAVPINMMILGCNLSSSLQTFTSDKLEQSGMLPVSSMVGIAAGKMIFLPMIGLATASFLRNFVLNVPDDINGSFYLALMIVFLTPTANNVMVMVELAGSNAKEGIATSIFLQYLSAPLILTFTMTIVIGYASKWS